MASTSIIIPPFPGSHSLQPRLYWARWQQAVLDAAGASNPTNVQALGQGILGFAVSPAQWAHMGYQPFVPQQPPNGIPNAAGFPAHKLQLDAYEAEVTAVARFKTALVLALDPIYHNLIADANGSTRNVTILAIMTILEAEFGVATPAELAGQRQRLSLPYSPERTLIAHLAAHADVHAAFHRANQALPEAEKVQHMLTSILPCGIFAMAVTQFQTQFFTVADQRYEDLIVLLKRHEHHSQTSSAGGYALGSIQQSDQIAALQATVARLETQLHSIRRTDSTSVSVPSSPKFWCWTHGPTNKDGGHNSNNCFAPKKGHRPDATFAVQLK